MRVKANYKSAELVDANSEGIQISSGTQLRPSTTLSLPSGRYFKLMITLPTNVTYDDIYVLIFSDLKKKHVLRILKSSDFNPMDMYPKEKSKLVAIVKKNGRNENVLVLDFKVTQPFTFSFQLRGCGGKFSTFLLKFDIFCSRNLRSY